MSNILRAALLGSFSIVATAAMAQSENGLDYADAVAIADGFERVDEFTIETDHDLLAQEPRGKDGMINALVEIPTGTSAKWEVGDDKSQTIWEQLEDGPRVVQYLGYPGNYGLIPGTALPKDLGGDGDPLDVIVLGQAAPRGTELPVRLIGVLKMTDQGETDDKLIAVMTEGSPLAAVESLDQLDDEFPGTREIVSTWFTNYKGPDGGMVNQGFGDAEEAREIFEQATENYAGTN